MVDSQGLFLLVTFNPIALETTVLLFLEMASTLFPYPISANDPGGIAADFVRLWRAESCQHQSMVFLP